MITDTGEVSTPKQVTIDDVHALARAYRNWGSGVATTSSAR